MGEHSQLEEVVLQDMRQHLVDKKRTVEVTHAYVGPGTFYHAPLETEFELNEGNAVVYAESTGGHMNSKMMHYSLRIEDGKWVIESHNLAGCS